MKYNCPVCGYDALAKPPVDYYICPCCGTEFGYDDVAHTWDELRNLWLSKGASWFSKHTPPPPEWDVLNQVARLNVRNVQNITGTSSEITLINEAGLLNKVKVMIFSENDVPIRALATTDNVEVKKANKVAA